MYYLYFDFVNNWMDNILLKDSGCKNMMDDVGDDGDSDVDVDDDVVYGVVYGVVYYVVYYVVYGVVYDGDNPYLFLQLWDILG